MQLKNKRIAITGASSGIGRAILQACLSEGAMVAACSRSITKKNIAAHDHLHLADVDVCDHASVKHWMDDVVKKLGGIDVFINNAGVMYYTEMHKCDYETWLKTLDVNCKGFLNCIDACLPQLIASKGHMINMTSDAGKKPFPGIAVYSGSKAFMEFTVQAMRTELIEQGVRLTNIQPGNVDTPLQDMSLDKAAHQKYSDQDVKNYLKADDIARAVIYALTQPAHVAVNELLIEPTTEPI